MTTTSQPSFSFAPESVRWLDVFLTALDQASPRNRRCFGLEREAFTELVDALQADIDAHDTGYFRDW